MTQRRPSNQQPPTTPRPMSGGERRGAPARVRDAPGRGGRSEAAARGRGREVPPPRRRKRARPGRWILGIVGVLVLALVALLVYVDTALQRTDAITDYSGRPAATAGTNWLLVGSDSRQGLDAESAEQLSTGDSEAVAGQRTDTMMLLHLPDGGAAPTLVSLPRDSSVPIPGRGRDKLNAAYAYGGGSLLTRTVEQATGLRVDHYAEVGFGGFAGVVDAVGGVRMCLDEPLQDPKAGLDLPAGCQELEGPQALGYVRTRNFARGDLERVAHQRKFLSALLDKTTSPGTLVNPFRMVPLLTNSADAITVDSGDHIWHLGGLALALGSGDLVTTTVPFASVSPTVRWNRDQALEMFNALAEDRPVPKDVLVQPPG